MMRSRATLALLVLVTSATGGRAGVSDNCPEGFTGSDRKPVKIRTLSSGSSYTQVNSGNPVTARRWFDLTCQWDSNFPNGLSSADKQKYKNKTFSAIENKKIVLRGYLLSVKKDGGDNDFHVEIGDRAAWDSRHLIAEFPSVPYACEARKLLVDLVDQDIQKYNKAYSGNKHAFHKAVKIEVSGFVFLDMHHATSGGVLCEEDGGRGLQSIDSSGHVVGLYEIHPAFSVKVLQH